MDLSTFPRTPLCRLPTPLEPLENLTRVLGGPRLLIKRDDMTGLAMGGNKARQLEFYLGQALDQGADTIVTTGAIQSNHACMTAAAAARLGLACHIQLETRVPGKGPEYAGTGNVLLDRMFGAILHTFPEGEDEAAADAALDRIAEDVRRRGGRPYVVHLGLGHPPWGGLGYVDAARETTGQADALGIDVDAVVLASGSGSTHGGMLIGLRAQGKDIGVHGVCVRRDKASQRARIIERVGEIESLLGVADPVPEGDILLTDDYLGPGYGQVTPELLEATSLLARTEGLLADPVYSGKALAALVGMARDGVWSKDETVVFLHTGGLPAIFAYADALGGL